MIQRPLSAVCPSLTSNRYIPEGSVDRRPPGFHRPCRSVLPRMSMSRYLGIRTKGSREMFSVPSLEGLGKRISSFERPAEAASSLVSPGRVFFLPWKYSSPPDSFPMTTSGMESPFRSAKVGTSCRPCRGCTNSVSTPGISRNLIFGRHRLLPK